MRRMALWLSLVLFACCPQPGQAETFNVIGDSIEPGGPGGAIFRDICPLGTILAGVNVTFGKDMNSVAAVCRRLENGQLVGDLIALSTRGRPGGKQGYARCNNLVQGMWVATSRVNLVHHIEFVCRHYTTRKIRTGVVLDSETVSRLTHGGEAATTALAECGAGAFAVGIFGAHGTNIDRLGLVCGVVEAPQPVPQAQPAPRPEAEKPKRGAPLPVGEGGNGGQQGFAGDGGGGRGSASTDTTIYDEPGGSDLAYLSAGDPVRIVQCGSPDNWCQISAPTAGWVWGPELDR